MAAKPNRPKNPRTRNWRVTFVDGEVVELEALHRAEARHYAKAFSRVDGCGSMRNYRRVKKAVLIKEKETPQ